jgi:hypothetical protein
MTIDFMTIDLMTIDLDDIQARYEAILDGDERWGTVQGQIRAGLAAVIAAVKRLRADNEALRERCLWHEADQTAGFHAAAALIAENTELRREQEAVMAWLRAKADAPRLTWAEIVAEVDRRSERGVHRRKGDE